MANTDWSLVSEFHVYDDGSTDGTREFLEQEIQTRIAGPVARAEPTGLANIPFHFGQTNLRSPMGVTLDWIIRSRAPLLAKLDNDTIYPPGWLNVALSVMHAHPELDML